MTVVSVREFTDSLLVTVMKSSEQRNLRRSVRIYEWFFLHMLKIISSEGEERKDSLQLRKDGGVSSLRRDPKRIALRRIFRMGMGTCCMRSSRDEMAVKHWISARSVG